MLWFVSTDYRFACNDSVNHIKPVSQLHGHAVTSQLGPHLPTPTILSKKERQVRGVNEINV